MANATIRRSISVSRASDGSGVDYKTPKQSSVVTMTGNRGPTPGTIIVPTTGVNVDLSQLSAYGGYIELTHQGNDETNFVTWGIWDGVRFYPIGKLTPTKPAGWFLSDFFSGEVTSGTGTANTDVNWLRLYSWAQSVPVFVGAFDP